MKHHEPLKSLAKTLCTSLLALAVGSAPVFAQEMTPISYPETSLSLATENPVGESRTISVLLSTTGTVVNSLGTPQEGVTVSLMYGGKTLYQTTTDSFGSYTFYNVKEGMYNMKLQGSSIHTTLLAISVGDIVLPTVNLPEHFINNTVTIDSKTPVLYVNGISQVADWVASTSTDTSSIALDLNISSDTSEENQDTIQENKYTKDWIATYFDLTLIKSVNSFWAFNSTEYLNEVNQLLEITFEIPTEFQGKDSYTIYRLHQGTMDRLTTTANSSGERIILSNSNTMVTMYVKKMGTFALSYTDSNLGLDYNEDHEFTVTVNPLYQGASTSSNFMGTVTASTKTAKQGSYVTFQVSPKTGYQAEYAKVTDETGRSLTLGTNSTGSFRFVQPTYNVVITVSFVPITSDGTTSPSLPDTSTPTFTYFNDVAVTDSYCKAINEVVTRGLMAGTGNGNFSPGDSLTRGMIVTILQVMAGEYSGLTSQFSDVFSTDYFAPAVAWAQNVGVVSGYNDGTFRPHEPVSREELAVILYRYCQMYENLYTPVGPSVTFSDSGDISFWALEAVTWCVKHQLLEEKYTGHLMPQSYATRADVAVSIYNMF